MRRLLDGLLRAAARCLVFVLPLFIILFFCDTFVYGRYRGLPIAAVLFWLDVKLVKWLDLW